MTLVKLIALSFRSQIFLYRRLSSDNIHYRNLYLRGKPETGVRLKLLKTLPIGDLGLGVELESAAIQLEAGMAQQRRAKGEESRERNSLFERDALGFSANWTTQKSRLDWTVRCRLDVASWAR